MRFPVWLTGVLFFLYLCCLCALGILSAQGGPLSGRQAFVLCAVASLLYLLAVLVIRRR